PSPVRYTGPSRLHRAARSSGTPLKTRFEKLLERSRQSSRRQDSSLTTESMIWRWSWRRTLGGFGFCQETLSKVVSFLLNFLTRIRARYHVPDHLRSMVRVCWRLDGAGSKSPRNGTRKRSQ